MTKPRKDQDDEAIPLSAEDMERKFAECGMPAFLKSCTQHSKPRGSKSPLKNARERRITWTLPPDDEFVAFILLWTDPSGEERRLIYEFVCPEGGQTYRLKFSSPPL